MLNAEFDRLGEGFDAEVESYEHRAFVTVGSVTGISSVISVGYIVWAIRGGSLLASMLSAVPLWSLLDPLPVLEFTDKDTKRRKKRRQADVDPDEERVQSIFG